MATGGNRGFTLIEVLVAVAICGIALGVALSGLSQGHRATERALSMERAGRAMQMALLALASKEDEDLDQGVALEGEIPGMEGWEYRVEVGPLSLKLTHEAKDTDEGEETGETEEETIEDEALKELKVEVVDPKGRTYSMVMWQ